MKRLIKPLTISLPLLISLSLQANEIKLDSIGLNLGYSNTSYKQKDISGSLPIPNNPNESFNSYELYTNINNILPYELKTYTSYTTSNNSELNHQYILLGISKYYNLNTTSLYASILTGYGILKYKYNLVNSTNNDTTSTSLITGVQLGLEYLISNNVFLSLNTKYLLHDYVFKLNPNAAISELSHKNTINLTIGIGWRFKTY